MLAERAFYCSSPEVSVFFGLYAKRGSWNRKKKIAVENKKVMVHEKIKYSIKLYISQDISLNIVFSLHSSVYYEI